MPDYEKVSQSVVVSLSQEGRCGGGIAYQDTLQVHPCKLGRDIHVAHGPEERYHTPSATCIGMGQWFLMDELPVG